jgi:glycosyltransferase involved in cell wall biosynthesis
LKLILAGPVTSDVALARLQSAMRRFDPAGSFVEYLGEVPHADMPSLYASADMAVFASTCENLPMIVLEKMAMGLPISCSEYPAMWALLGENAACYPLFPGVFAVTPATARGNFPTQSFQSRGL